MIKKIYHRHQETIHNFFWKSLQTFGKQGITFLIFILCAKLLSPYEFGIYNYSLAIIFFLIIFGDFGISAATSKYVAEYNVTNQDKLKSVLFNSGIIILGITILITLFAFLIGPEYLKDKYVYILWLLPLIFLAPMTSLYDGIYRGLKKFKKLAIISVIIGVLSIPMAYYFVKVHGLIGALIAQDIFYFVLLTTLGFGYGKFYFRFNKEVMKEIGRYALMIGLGELGFLLYSKANVIILGYFNYVIEIGYYELANKVIMLLLIPFSILGQIIAPNITKLTIQNKKNLILKKYIKHVILIFFISLFITLFLYLSYPFLLKIFLQTYFINDSILIFNLLLIVFPFSILANFISQAYLFSSGNAKYNLLVIPFGILNILLSIFFIHLFGFIGVIYSIILCTCIYRVIVFIRLYIFFKK